MRDGDKMHYLLFVLSLITVMILNSLETTILQSNFKNVYRTMKLEYNILIIS